MALPTAPVFQPSFPPPVLPPPTSGVPVIFTLTGASSVSIQVYRRRARAVSWPILRPGRAPLVQLDGTPFTNVNRVLVEAGEVVALGGSGGPVAYSTFSDDLTGSINGSVPWIWWQAASGPSLPAGARITLTGGMQVGNVALVVGNDGIVSWTS